ncbi:hypothetical protein FB45DRAFT_278656 [Roridomyces roridus]|uniref:YTH domain-containing protein n=1 Tax=Roridomyces roridus TaxID=1738132 RepID=A0AAD7FU92_9AGAR|nr:hypothetical protein FB45DRAFT_278656 [Roridomyces roridus]
MGMREDVEESGRTGLRATWTVMSPPASSTSLTPSRAPPSTTACPSRRFFLNTSDFPRTIPGSRLSTGTHLVDDSLVPLETSGVPWLDTMIPGQREAAAWVYVPQGSCWLPRAGAELQSFALQWICTEWLPFTRTRHIRNPWNSGREVKVSRDGTEPGGAQALLEEWTCLRE